MSIIPDSNITGDIIRALAEDARVHEDDIHVHTIYGFVRLEGTVSTMAEKEAAQEDAACICGVQGVENEIVIESAGNMSDMDIQGLVDDLLMREGIDGVGARVEAGNVFLMGRVPSLAVKERAILVSEMAHGVRGVYSELHIVAGEPKDNLKLADDVVEALTDDPRLTVADLKVVADEGAVKLFGIVPNPTQEQIAVDIAKAVPGVEQLEDDISISRQAI